MSPVEWIVSHDVREGLERHGDAGKGRGREFRSSVVDHNRDLKSKEEKIDERSRLRVTMGRGGTDSLFRRDHNRDLKSKEGKIDGRSRPAMSPSNGLRITMGERGWRDTETRGHGEGKLIDLLPLHRFSYGT